MNPSVVVPSRQWPSKLTDLRVSDDGKASAELVPQCEGNGYG